MCRRRLVDPPRHRKAALFGALLLSAFADAADSGIGFPSVRAAYQALSTLPQAQIRVTDGWTVVTDGAVGPQTTWTFAPRSHPAYPVLIRRDAVMKNGKPTLVTRFRCEGRPHACDSLYDTLQNAD